jgi:hypothetical protein
MAMIPRRDPDESGVKPGETAVTAEIGGSEGDETGSR